MICIILVFCLSVCFRDACCQVDATGSGRAIFFDGLNDFVDLGNIYDDVRLPLSISAWIFVPEGNVGTFPIFHSQDDLSTNTYNGFVLIVSTAPHIGLTLGDGQGGFDPSFRRSKAARFGSILGRWINVAVVARTTTDMDIYLNGFNIGGNYEGFSNFQMNSFAPNAIAKIGSWWSNNQLFFFKGMIDELRIWSRALTEEEIRRDMCVRLVGNEPGLIGYWDFNETSGNTVFDKSPNGFHGQLVGNPTRVFSGAPIGNSSAYLYTTNWSGKVVSMQTGENKFTVKDLLGPNDGVHLYQVNVSPSQMDGLDLTYPTQPYFGAFLASQQIPGSFQAEYAFQNQTTCEVQTRLDNSINRWEKASNPVIQVMQRGEFLRGKIGDRLMLNLGEDMVLCDRSSYEISTGLNGPGLAFKWNTGQVTPSITVTNNGRYIVEVSNDCSVAKDTIDIAFLSTPKPFSFGEDRFLCEPMGVQLTVTPSASTNIKWQDGSSEPKFLVTRHGTYSAELSNSCGRAYDEITFYPFPEHDKFFPNVLTPNNDGKNDRFVIDERFVGLLSLRVFNRWGKEVYRSAAYDNSWTPTGLSSGTYYLIFEGACLPTTKGILTIVTD